MTTHQPVSSKLKHIRLKNFQAFGEEVTVPLDRIVMLFGPNSAGKSAVLDSIHVMADMFVSFAEASSLPGLFVPLPAERNGVSISDWCDRLRRYARKQMHDGKSGATAEPLISQVSVNFSMVESTFSRVFNGWVAGSGDAKNRLHDVTFELSFAEPITGGKRPPMAWSFEVTVNGRVLLTLMDGEGMGMNPSHELFQSVQEKFNDATTRKFLELPQRRATIEDGLISWRLVPEFFDWHLDYGSMKDDLCKDVEVDGALSPTETERYLRLAESAFDGFAVFFKSSLSAICSAAYDVCSCTLVDASRKIPTPKELQYQFERNSYGHINEIEESSIQTNGLPLYKELAKELFSEWWQGVLSENGNQSEVKPAVAMPLHALVNRALTDSLFVEKLYQCCVDVKVVLEASDIQSLLADATYHPARIANADCLVSLKLKDSEGRHLDFIDVGSGLGYLLPVLVALYENNYRERLVFMQQPELHLHPALQAALGDVILDATQERCAAMIETHSEHLLLRLLRRIRESSSSNSTLPKDLRVQPSQLVVLYFDPQFNGQTKVRHIRISDDGDFLDRWPRGFFDEREKELFGGLGPTSDE